MAHVSAGHYCFGFSTGATATAAWEWLRSPTAISTAAFLGSVVATGLNYLIARRAELRRAELEALRDRREFDREQRLADALTELKIARARAEASRVEPVSPPP